MYKVIGSDNREYGPASEDVLLRWIAEGRANGSTQLQKEGESGWRSLSSFPEFAAALATAAAAGAVPPPAVGAAPAGAAPVGAGPDIFRAAAAPVDADALAAELIARDVSLDVGGCFQESWNLIQRNFWLVVAAWAVSFFVACGVGFIPYVGFPAALVLGGVLLAGLHLFFLRLLRGEPASVADVFAGFGPSIGPLILCGIVSGLLGWFGFLLCIVPGIYLSVCWHLAPLVVIDKKLEFWAAMELARKVVTHHWWAMFGLALVAICLYLFGALCCGIALFITGPIATGAMVVAYRRLFEISAVPTAPAAPTPTVVAP